MCRIFPVAAARNQASIRADFIVKYRPEIDGLRAIAVLAVLFYHAQLGCPGGYVGVDIFFVISGYLICRTISQEIAAGSFTYRVFWARRIRRLLAALAVMLGVVVVLGWLFLFPEDYRELGLTVASQPLLGTNVVFWRTVKDGYFGDVPEIRPTLHTWSLAVEEQFYLLCPLLLIYLARLRNRRSGAVLAGIALASWLVSGLLTEIKPVFCYFLLPTRAFEILVGGLVWYCPTPGTRVARDVFCALGFAGVACSISMFSDASVFPGWLALLPCLGTALLLSAAVPGTTSVRLLALSPMVWVGKISYSLYLWHWPLIAFWRYLGLPWSTSHRLLLVGLSLLAGFLSTYAIENPVRKRRYFASDVSLFRAAAWFALLCLGAGSCLWVARGFPQRYSPSTLKSLEVDRGFRSELSLEDLQNKRFVRFGATKLARRRLFLWGDSHAMAILAGLDEVCRRAGVAGEAATRSSHAPFFCVRNKIERFDAIEARERHELVMSYLKQSHPDGVILVARWDFYVADDYLTELRNTLQFLAAEHLPTWIVLQVPRQEEDVPRWLAFQSHWGKGLAQCGVALAQHRDNCQEFISCLDILKFPLSRRLDPTDLLLSSTGICRTNDHGHTLYFDDDHLSTAGSRFVEPMYEPLLAELRKPRE